MNPGVLVVELVGAGVALVGLMFLVVKLATAGKGAFLKERNEELAAAYEQVVSQLNNDRERYTEMIADLSTKSEAAICGLREQVKELQGELAASRVEYAKVIAIEVIRALERDGWVKDRVRGAQGAHGSEGARGPAGHDGHDGRDGRDR